MSACREVEVHADAVFGSMETVHEMLASTDEDGRTPLWLGASCAASLQVTEGCLECL